MAEFKTNVMRMLDKEKVPYTPHTYDHGDGAIDGASVAAKMGQDPARVFKTLVTQGAGKSYFVYLNNRQYSESLDYPNDEVAIKYFRHCIDDQPGDPNFYD